MKISLIFIELWFVATEVGYISGWRGKTYFSVEKICIIFEKFKLESVKCVKYRIQVSNFIIFLNKNETNTSEIVHKSNGT